MLTAKEVLGEYFLDVRCMLLEIAATLDRYDAACKRDGAPAPGNKEQREQLEKIYESLCILADRNAPPNRSEQLLNLFSDE